MNESQNTLSEAAWLKRIRQHIPGFDGYADPEKRTEEDERFRRFLDRAVARSVVRVEDLEHSVAEEKRLDLLSDFDHILSGLKHLREVLALPPDAEEDAADINSETISEWHREDCEYLEGLAAFIERIEQLPASCPERNDVLLLKDTLDRLLQRIHERSRRDVPVTDAPEREDG